VSRQLVLIWVGGGYQQRQARPFGSPGFRAMQNRPRNSSTGLVELQDRGFVDCMTKRGIQPEGTARHRMASDLVELRCHWRTGQQEIHELGRKKENAVSNYPVAVSNQSQRAA
jgi:hypothetical protein